MTRNASLMENAAQFTMEEKSSSKTADRINDLQDFILLLQISLFPLFSLTLCSYSAN